MSELNIYSMIKAFIVIFITFNLFACNPNQQASQSTVTQPQIPFTCLASQSSCEVLTKLGAFTIEFSGNVVMGKIKTELPFQIQLKFNAKTNDSELKSINSFLEGKNMFMGKIPVFFELPEKRTDLIVAETLLASCSEEIMTWRLWFSVEVEERGNTEQLEFFIDFDSQRL